MKAGKQDALTTSNSVEWYTPQEILDAVEEVAPIALDPCWAPGCVVKAERTFTKEQDGLVNPPYGRGMDAWIRKCESAQAAHVVALLPARLEMAWFQDLVAPETAEEVRDDRAVCFVRGRVRFSGAKAKAPFPNLIAYWGDDPKRFEQVFEKLGTVWRAT